MPGGKWYSSIKCFRVAFVSLLIVLVVVGVVIYTNTNLKSFIGIVLIATPSLVLLAVVALALNSYCHHHYSRSLDIHGVTDGLEFDEIDMKVWHSNRTSRRTSVTDVTNTTNNQRHSLDPNSPILDLIPFDNSDNEEHDVNEAEQPLNPNGVDDNTDLQPLLHTVIDVIPEEDEEGEEEQQQNETENGNNISLPTYEDAISSYGEEETSSGGLPSYQEAVHIEDSS